MKKYFTDGKTREKKDNYEPKKDKKAKGRKLKELEREQDERDAQQWLCD